MGERGRARKIRPYERGERGKEGGKEREREGQRKEERERER